MRVLPLCREAVDVFYSPNRLGKREKARRELSKDIACFEQILEVVAYKAAVVPPLTLHLINYLRQARHAEYRWRRKDEPVSVCRYCILACRQFLLFDAKEY